MPNCELCGEPMSEGEEMFKIHGYSGPCPKPPLPSAVAYDPKDDVILAANKRIHELKGALTSIKKLCSGDRVPNWSDDRATTITRGRIMDICKIADP
jgi:hypothetical protein